MITLLKHFQNVRKFSADVLRGLASKEELIGKIISLKRHYARVHNADSIIPEGTFTAEVQVMISRIA